MLALVESRTASSGRTSHRRWNQRTTAVVGLMLSGLAVPVTGLLDHAAGREWAVPHTALGLLFVAFCVWHVVLNRRALLRYLTRPLVWHWHRRAWVVAGALLCGLTLPLTGLLDHAAGREWALVHAAPGVLFVVLCVWHALLNRRGVLCHLSRRIPAGWGLPSREALASAVVTAVVVGGTVVHALEV
jgi:hypothetical protein